MEALLKALQKVLVYKTLHNKKDSKQTMIVYAIDLNRTLTGDKILFKGLASTWYNLEDWELRGECAYIIRDNYVTDKNMYWTGCDWTENSKDAAFFNEERAELVARYLRNYCTSHSSFSTFPVAIVSDYSIHKD